MKTQMLVFTLILLVELVIAQPLIITTDVYDVEIVLATPFGGFLDNAQVQVKKLDGSIISTTSDGNGKVLAEDIPKGILYVKVVSWKGMQLDTEWYEASLLNNMVIVDKIGLLRVKVVGERGQGLAGATVYIEGTPLSGSTGEDGVAEFLLPENSYEVKVCLGDTCSSTTATVPGGEIAETMVSLPVFLEVSPKLTMSFKEFLFAVIIAVAVIAVSFIALYEYSVWRRRRMARVVKPAGP